MKVLFLDIDGVLNSRAWAERHGDGWAKRLDPLAMAELERIVEATSAWIVVSSSWRLRRTLTGLRDILAAAGMPADLRNRIIDTTPSQRYDEPPDSYLRGNEIRAWLEMEAPRYEARPFYGPIESFVILDDNNDMGAVSDRLVQTDWSLGLTAADADRAIALLSEPVRRTA